MMKYVVSQPSHGMKYKCTRGEPLLAASLMTNAAIITATAAKVGAKMRWFSTTLAQWLLVCGGRR